MAQDQIMVFARGIPASGKSTWSQKWVAQDPENRARVNRDDIRYAMYGEYVLTKPEVKNGKPTGRTIMDGEKEGRVSEMEYKLIDAYFKEGKSVVSDNTNLSPKRLKPYLAIARKHGIRVAHKDFPITKEEAKLRNANRDRDVPDYVIDRMYSSLGPNGEFHLFPGSYPTRPFVKPEQREHAVIFDMDGTLTRISSVRHFVSPDRKHKDFDSFHRSSLFCPPNKEVLQMAKDTTKADLRNVIVTARSEEYRAVTEKWLNDHGVEFSNLYMRRDNDNRVDHVVKAEILKKIQEDYDIIHAVDDRPAVIEVWKSAGIQTTLVPGLEKENDPDLDVNEEPHINNLLRTGGCLRCGRPLTDGKVLGSYCAKVS